MTIVTEKLQCCQYNEQLLGKLIETKMCVKSEGVRSGLFLGFGSLLVVSGAVMVMMILSPDSMSFSIWRETPIPMFLEIFFFNISNVNEILSGTAEKIKVVEMGPYVFQESHTKVNLTWNDNSTLTFYNQRFWHFRPEMSAGSIGDNITSINPVIATVAYLMRKQRLPLKVSVDLFLRMFHPNLFQTANVTSWLFDGIEDRRNGSIEYDGSFNINTGASDFSQLGNVHEWRYASRTDYRDECGEVKGSTGELWAPEYGQPELNVFASDICTYLTIAKDRAVQVEGIDGVQYAANDSVFDNGYKYPRMACYCDSVRDAECLPAGALNVSDCRDMNFRLALEMFTGMPLSVAAQLQINLLVRHISGITIILHTEQRHRSLCNFFPQPQKCLCLPFLLLNVYFPNVLSINNVLPDPDTMVPMFRFRQETATTPEYAALARSALRLRNWVPYGLYVLTAIGVALLIGGITVLVRKLMRSPDTAPLITSESSRSTDTLES
ncbi:hypothetical protein SFRURICE_007343 [Spodoptera frugiperda]|nr:hypothetical protein SFRURICE_007343 [Spodoptera frugiperda]